MYAWRDGERSIVPVITILGQLAAMGTPVPLDLVVITGGEPLLQQHNPGLKALVDSLIRQGIRVQFETNGTQVPELWLQEYALQLWCCHVRRFAEAPGPPGQ